MRSLKYLLLTIAILFTSCANPIDVIYTSPMTGIVYKETVGDGKINVEVDLSQADLTDIKLPKGLAVEPTK